MTTMRSRGVFLEHVEVDEADVADPAGVRPVQVDHVDQAWQHYRRPVIDHRDDMSR